MNACRLHMLEQGKRPRFPGYQETVSRVVFLCSFSGRLPAQPSGDTGGAEYLGPSRKRASIPVTVSKFVARSALLPHPVHVEELHFAWCK